MNKEDLIKRFKHYFKSYALRHEKSTEEIAEHFGLSLSAYRKYTSSKNNKILHAYETLEKTAQLENMNVGEFCLYLENKVHLDNSKKNMWSEVLIGCFQEVSPLLRRQFIYQFIEKSNKEELTEFLQFANSYNKLPKKRKEAYRSLVNEEFNQ